MKKDLLDNNVLPLSPETINEVTVGGADDPFLPSANKKSQMQQGPADKEKKKGVHVLLLIAVSLCKFVLIASPSSPSSFSSSLFSLYFMIIIGPPPPLQRLLLMYPR